MIYDRNTRELSTNAGKLLKKLDCPLYKHWQELKITSKDQSKRFCVSCRKNVINLENLGEEEAEALLTQSPDACVYIPPLSPNVKIRGKYHRPQMPEPPCPFRKIHTARGEEAIHEGVKKGFWPLVKRVERSPEISDWMAVYQNEETGDIVIYNDVRDDPQPPWKQIIEPFRFYPYPVLHEIAAYLIPKYLTVGERVFLTDLIEERVGIYGNQGATYRLECAYAIWDGKEFQIEWDEKKDAPVWIG